MGSIHSIGQPNLLAKPFRGNSAVQSGRRRSI
jgi:hypothetical protein